MLSRKQQTLFNAINKLLRKGATVRLERFLERVHPADLALICRFLSIENQQKIFSLVQSDEAKAFVLAELDDVIATNLVEAMSGEELGRILQHMDPDDAADLLAEVDPELKESVLQTLQVENREELKEILQYPPDTAGGIMTPMFVGVPATTTAGQALQEVQTREDEPELISYVYATDEHGELVGVVSLRELLQASEHDVIEDFMETDLISAHVSQDQEEVARMIANYDLLAAPVIDDKGAIVGIVTVDDIIDVIREEATEDILRLVGANEEVLEDYSLKQNIIYRAPWLLASWAGGILVMWVISMFEPTLEKVLPLAAFIPVVIGMAGNLGAQSATIVVRGLALGRIHVDQILFTMLNEIGTGIALGSVYGLLLGAVAYLIYDEISMIGFVVGFALCVAMIFAAAIGAFVPMALQRMNFDPAVSTGPFVTTSIDIVGITAYFIIATLLMPGLS